MFKTSYLVNIAVARSSNSRSYFIKALNYIHTSKVEFIIGLQLLLFQSNITMLLSLNCNELHDLKKKGQPVA